ncbi:glycosyl hydrolase [Xylariales sp. PMI_506]|nr:glycosyl hydrolase [Xylariales sp. PMI_506]
MASSSSAAFIFQNPIIRGFNPDPTICVVPSNTLSFSPPPAAAAALAATPDDTPPSSRSTAASAAAAETHYFLSTSTFEYFPGCAIYHSTDLLNWALIGHALTRRSQAEMRTVEPGGGSWASTLRYRPGAAAGGRGGRWYLANGLFSRYRPGSDERIFPRGFYVYTDNIWDSNAWSDPIYFDNPGFDQDLFWDDTTSKVYLSTTVRLAKRPPGSKLKDFGIHVSEIELATGRTLTPPVAIRQSPHGIAEGSHLFRRGAYYYLLTAEGGTEAGHQEWVFRSKEGVYGPWEAQGRPLWYNGPDEEVQRTGHADVFEDGQGQWWGVFLGVRPVQSVGGDGQRKFLEPPMGRETFLVTVDWVDDWPVFNGGSNITLVTTGRSGAGPVIQWITETKVGDVKWKANLDKDELELGWYQKCECDPRESLPSLQVFFVLQNALSPVFPTKFGLTNDKRTNSGTPLKQCYSLLERPGYLRIWGNCYDLSWPEAPAMLLRKQSSYTEIFHTALEFRPSQPNYEAGVTIWWSQYSYATIGITLFEFPTGQCIRTVVCRRPLGEAGAVEQFMPFVVHEEEPEDIQSIVALRIETQPTTYTLSISAGDKTHEFSFPTAHLTVMPPVGGAFCGVMFGLYSFGKGEPVLDPADFSNIFIQESSGEN